MDHRDAAAKGRPDGLVPDEKKMVLVDNYEDVEGEEPVNLGELQAKYEVCQTCDGKGRHVNPSVDSHGITRDEFDEDPGFMEAYVRGDYDVTCYECKGKRVTLEVDRHFLSDQKIHILKSRIEHHYYYLAEQEAERRMGC